MPGPIVPVVIDTNVLVPSLYSFTPIAQFLLSGNLILIWNNQIFSEACEIIDRLAIRYITKAGVHPEEAIKLLELITIEGYPVKEMPKNWPKVSPDRKDDPFLWAALKGDAEYIISDDKSHLLSLKEFRGIPIGKPRNFFQWVIKNHPMSIKKVKPSLFYEAEGCGQHFNEITIWGSTSED